MDNVPFLVQICSPEVNRFGVGATGPAYVEAAPAYAERPLRHRQA